METSGSFGKSRRKRRKRLHLYLIDDDYNTFENVIYALQAVLPNCNSLLAEQIAMITHNTGEAELYSGFGNDVYIKYAQLQKLGLNVDIRTK
jgi:ATP-dependent Clp protease adapter protein ClpS